MGLDLVCMAYIDPRHCTESPGPYYSLNIIMILNSETLNYFTATKYFKFVEVDYVSNSVFPYCNCMPVPYVSSALLAFSVYKISLKLFPKK